MCRIVSRWEAHCLVYFLSRLLRGIICGLDERSVRRLTVQTCIVEVVRDACSVITHLPKSTIDTAFRVFLVLLMLVTDFHLGF
jgi:hypothetical protein